MFQHTTSLPYHPQSNGKAEFLVWLHWHKTQTKGIGTGPNQLLMGHQCETLLPVAGTFLRPQYSTEEETHALFGKKQRQQYYYNQLTKPQQAIGHGETVHMKLPGQKMWSAGTCMGQVGPLSYKVKVGESVCGHNCRNHPL